MFFHTCRDFKRKEGSKKRGGKRFLRLNPSQKKATVRPSRGRRGSSLVTGSVGNEGGNLTHA